MTAHPIALEALIAWWTGDLSADDVAHVEQHLFACDECAGVSERFASLAASLGELIPPVISHAHRDRLVAQGTRIRVTPVDEGVSTSAFFGPEVDLLVHALRADLSRAQRVDVEIVMQGGREPLLFEGVPFNAKAGEILICCKRHFEHLSPVDPTFRVHTVEAGQRRTVGEYFVRHIWR